MKSMYQRYVKAGALFWAACFIGFFLFYLIVLGPQEKLRGQIERRLAETQRLAQAAADAAQEKNKAALVGQVRQLRQTLDRFVMGEKSADSLTLDVRAIPGREGINVSDIIAGGGESNVKFDNCEHIFGKKLNVTFASSFSQFAAFLNALERNEPVIFFIDEFSITRSREAAAGHAVNMSLAVLVSKDGPTKETGG